MIGEIRAEAERLGITRLCHYTPFRNLVHIATDGLRSTQNLQVAERRAFNKQDLQRLDGHPDHISCSIEFPNAWYYRSKTNLRQGEDKLFRTWVVITFAPHYLWADETLFCHRNASAEHGAYVRSGYQAFQYLYDAPVIGAGYREYRRQKDRLACAPTDDQAEVLVHRFVSLDDVYTIAVADEDQARQVWYGLEQIGAHPERFRFTVVPQFFRPTALSGMIARGEKPDEPTWQPPSDD